MHLLQISGRIPTKAEKKRLSDLQVLVEEGLRTHYSTLAELFPQLTHEFDLTPQAPIDDPVRLPSNILTTLHAQYGIEALAEAEHRLRIGRCYDCLEEVRRSLTMRSALVRYGRAPIGNKGLTRSVAAVERSTRVTEVWAAAYRKSRAALIELPYDDPSQHCLLPLERKDLGMLSSWVEEERYASQTTSSGSTLPRFQGSAQRMEMPWIWRMLPAQGVFREDAPLSQVEGLDRKVEEWTDEGVLNCST
jgi:hypothetical protein